MGEGVGVGQGNGGRYLVPSGRGRIGTGGPRGAQPQRSLGSSRSRDGGGSACTSGGGQVWDRGTGRRIPPAGRRPRLLSEQREGKRVRRGRIRLAHCTRGLGEGGGHPGTAGSMGVRIGGSGTSRYAASPGLGGKAGGWMGGMRAGDARQGRTEGLGGASSANCANAQGTAGGEQLPVHWHNIAGGGCSTGEEGARERWASVPGTVGAYACRTPRCRRGSAPLRGSCSQASGPLQRARPLAARAVGSRSEYGGQQRVRGGGVHRTSK